MDSITTLQELTWPKIRQRIKAVNPTFAKLVDEVNPDDTHTVFLAKYPYGSQILRYGKMFLPTKSGKLVAFEHIEDEIKQKIGYVMGTNPMTMVLKNTLDLYIALKDRNILFSLIETGDIFGTWQLLDEMRPGGMFFTPLTLWDMTAGARSIFMLPKVSDVNAFQRIQKKYDIKAEVPKSLLDQWQVFKAIANHPEFEQPWQTEILFFSKPWIDSMHDPKWSEIKSYIIAKSWSGSAFFRNQFCWELTFSRIQSGRGIKPGPYETDIASHLFGMSVGATPGFRPLLDDSVAPVTGLRRVFEDEYGIKYAPIIIGPANFSIFDPNALPVYYSFQYHTAMRLAQKSSNRSSILTDMYNIRSLLHKYLHDIQNSDLNISNSVFCEVAKTAHFTFFHYIADTETKMTSSNAILEYDVTFQAALKQCHTKVLPKNAPFLNGCVQISRKIDVE